MDESAGLVAQSMINRAHHAYGASHGGAQLHTTS